jgi:hypothetical protein
MVEISFSFGIGSEVPKLPSGFWLRSSQPRVCG